MNTKSDKAQKIIVDNDHSGQRLDNFLLNFLKGVPKSKIYSIINIKYLLAKSVNSFIL